MRGRCAPPFVNQFPVVKGLPKGTPAGIILEVAHGALWGR